VEAAEHAFVHLRCTAWSLWLGLVMLTEQRVAIQLASGVVKAVGAVEEGMKTDLHRE
jgi:hypothetical protein